jgi:hypothetical protein
MVTIIRSSNANPNFEITKSRTVNASAGSEGNMRSGYACKKEEAQLLVIVSSGHYLVLLNWPETFRALETTSVGPIAKGLESGSQVAGCRPVIRRSPLCFCLIVCRLVPGRTPVESNCVRDKRAKGKHS